MDVLFGNFHEWKEWAIDLLCSNEKCKRELTIDSRKVTNLIYCSKKCARLDGLTEAKK